MSKVNHGLLFIDKKNFKSTSKIYPLSTCRFDFLKSKSLFINNDKPQTIIFKQKNVWLIILHLIIYSVG
jgi:hypothetical protein